MESPNEPKGLEEPEVENDDNCYHSVQTESGINFNPFRPKPAYSDQMPDGRLPYA